MDNCLNILRESVIFLPSTALIVVILLVWAQLQASSPRFDSKKCSEDKENVIKGFTLYLGSAWLYLAILIALTAFALHVFDLYKYATGFLGLSFLMMASSVFLAFIRTLLLLRSEYKGESLVEVPKAGCEAWVLLGAAFFALAGLGIVSIGYAFGYSYWWVGVILVVGIGIYALIKMVRGMRKKRND